MIVPCPENQPHEAHSWYRLDPLYLESLNEKNQERADEIFTAKVKMYCPGVFSVHD